MSLKGQLLKAGIDSDGVSIDLYDSSASLKINGTRVVTSQQVAEADASTPSSFTAPASGAVTVTSNAATDLDTVSAALATLVSEVTSLTTKVNNILAKLRTHGLIAS